MEIALIGYGKMGSLVDEVARSQGHQVVARFTSEKPLDAREAPGRDLGDDVVLIDFTAPDSVAATVREAVDLGRPIVVGTTGWHERMDEVRARVEEGGIGLVHASNFALGTNLFYQVAEHAARLLASFESFDPYVQEAHHRFKLDSPSGTALVLRDILTDQYGARTIPMTSLRAGYSPSTHLVGFDSPVETIRIEHQARSRQAFAEGALLAARWIGGRRGCHAFGEVLADLVFPGPRPGPGCASELEMQQIATGEETRV